MLIGKRLAPVRKGRSQNGFYLYIQAPRNYPAVCPHPGGTGKAGQDSGGRALGTHSAVNAQPQRILVLNTREGLEKVREFCTFNYNPKCAELDSACDDKAHNRCVYYCGAPLVLLVCYDRGACWTHPESGESSGSTDAAIVSTHMMLEAASIGFGTVWISYFDKAKARTLLHLPESWEINNMLYIGYPAEDFVPNTKMSGKRYPLSHSVWYNSLEDGEILDTK